MYDVLILGSGPAGLTAAIYAARARLRTLVVAGMVWGGQLMLTTTVENYPGFPEGVQGPDLMDRMKAQAERFGAKLLYEDAVRVDFSSQPLKVWTDSQMLEGRAVIVATGASPKWLGLESEQRLRGRGVSTCATCDAPLYKGRRVVVVGGGDTAVEEALELTRFASEVSLIHRRDQLRAEKILQERLLNEGKVQLVWETVVREILGKDRVEGVRVQNVKTGEERTLECDAVFVAIGHVPNTEMLKGQVELNEQGYVVTREVTKTSVEGVFAAGDVEDMTYRQAVLAAGHGCRAALDAIRYLESKT
ncbi:MAG: thioredoxin-disulfide reductase [Candidatus Bathyarchaeia archaeon]